MLLLGKTSYRAASGEGSKKPVEIELGVIQIFGIRPSKFDLAQAINNHPGFTIQDDEYPIFKVTYIKTQLG
ncbi:hypothetical protein [Aquimarina algiphila]|uniref:hypothetical protein n=1 Tax=Aquimarina algiphila TaxID=2047982 RepID=UPI00232C56B3|nr:hypothetical protein [Aquimarina algiphila]